MLNEQLNESIPTAYKVEPSAPPMPPEGFLVSEEPYLLLEGGEERQNEPEPQPNQEPSSPVCRFLQVVGCFYFLYIIYLMFRNAIKN